MGNDDDVRFPLLDLATRRCNLNAGELAEAVLHGIDCGLDEMGAIRMSIIETLQRRGAYRGRVKQAIEDGTIFQMTEGGGHDGCGVRRMGRGGFESDSSSPKMRSVRNVVDAG